MEQNEFNQNLKNDILEIKKSIELLVKEISEIKKVKPSEFFRNPLLDKWIPRKDVMEFFGYGSTQMSELEKTHNLKGSKIGKRKFYLRDSIEKLLDDNSF